jgi:hypothetical protein
MEREKLLQDNEVLKDAYIKLMNDRDVMVEWGRTQLEALYATKIGVWQLEKLKLQLTVKALKRKIELVYQNVNAGVPPDFTEIDLKVAVELSAAEAAIAEQTKEVSNAKILLSHLNSPGKGAELRKIFKAIARQIHPDVNPEITEEQLNIWYKIKDAYDTGDLEKLKALQIIYEKEISRKPDGEPLSENEIALQNTTLQEGILLIEEEIARLKNEFPFNIEHKIKDEEWVLEEQEKIKKDINQLTQYEQQLTGEYETLRSKYG